MILNVHRVKGSSFGRGNQSGSRLDRIAGIEDLSERIRKDLQKKPKIEQTFLLESPLYAILKGRFLFQEWKERGGPHYEA